MISIESIKIFVLCFLLNLASCAADYQTIYKQDQAAEDNKNLDDNTPSTDDDKKIDDGGEPVVTDAGPVAGVEVVSDGNVVTEIVVGTEVSIRPTEETRDLDDKPRDNCRNIGITKADYSFEGASPKSVLRDSDECSDLSLKYKFDTPGDVLIEMTVHTGEAETAVASMTLSVVEKPANDDQTNSADKGFRIEADPMIAKVGDKISFEGICLASSEPTISWMFGDGEKATGKSQKHSYGKPGSYLVKSACVFDDKNLQASVTIVILDNSPDSDDNKNGDNDDGDKDGSGLDGGSDDKDSESDGNNDGNTGDNKGDGKGINDEDDDGSPVNDPSQNPNQGPEQSPSQN